MSTPASLGLTGHSSHARWKSWVFVAFLVLATAFGFVALGALLYQVFKDGAGHVTGQLLTNPPSQDPTIAGARPAILATIYLGVLVLAMAVPVGVLTAIYLEEYANRERWYNRLLEINIQNLAGVPSIVYGILGLAFIVRGLGLGRVLLAGALILTLLVLPTVIIASREAIRAVPGSIRDGAFALGATRWQVVWRQVLPAAVPGIATGAILALSRALGETAPLILIGAVTFITFDPTLLGQFTALPIQIFSWLTQVDPEFTKLAAGAIIVLLVIVLSMNLVAILVRNKFQRRW
jgi:phosphate transport system permease protein